LCTPLGDETSPDTALDEERERVGDADAAREERLDVLISEDLFIPVLPGGGDAFESLAFELAMLADIDMMPLNVTIAS
jgi:hypothetical protein